MYYMSEHGGDCCGRQHLHDFDDYPTKDRVDKVKRVLREYYGEDQDGDEMSYGDFGVEVALANYQYHHVTKEGKASVFSPDVPKTDPYIGKCWHQVLTEELGFKFVYSFVNPNTSNTIRVYFYSNNEVPVT